MRTEGVAWSYLYDSNTKIQFSGMATNTGHKIEKGEVVQVICAAIAVVLILWVWTSIK